MNKTRKELIHRLSDLITEGDIVSEGKLYRLELFFGHFDGRLKLFDGSSSEVLECTLG